MNRLGLYIHWPFCAAKCPYCDFNSHVSARIDQSRWRNAYVQEVERVARLTEGRVLSTVFFGGGTPSLMEPSLVAEILGAIRANWAIANDLEVTLEANPTSSEAEKFRKFAEAGVNRLSLGVQALNDTDLKALGRRHTAKEAILALSHARDAFPRVSFDLIYARQHQTLDAWEAELSHALEIAPDHLSLYQLTIEDGTAFGTRYREGKLKGLPQEDLAADLYELTQKLTTDAGFHAYEVSNHARSGAETKHNLIYWDSGDYAGIGPGAHGRLTLNGIRYATETPLDPETWLRSVEEDGAVDFPTVALSRDEHLAEFLLMGLRLRHGVSRERLLDLSPNLDLLDREKRLRAEGFLGPGTDRVALSDRGRPLLNSVLRELLS